MISIKFEAKDEGNGFPRANMQFEGKTNTFEMGMLVEVLMSLMQRESKISDDEFYEFIKELHKVSDSSKRLKGVVKKGKKTKNATDKNMSSKDTR